MSPFYIQGGCKYLCTELEALNITKHLLCVKSSASCQEYKDKNLPHSGETLNIWSEAVSAAGVLWNTMDLLYGKKDCKLACWLLFPRTLFTLLSSPNSCAWEHEIVSATLVLVLPTWDSLWLCLLAWFLLIANICDSFALCCLNWKLWINETLPLKTWQCLSLLSTPLLFLSSNTVFKKAI